MKEKRTLEESQFLYWDLLKMLQLGIFSFGTNAYRQNDMVKQLRNQVSEMHVDVFFVHSTLQCWKTSFKQKNVPVLVPSDDRRWIKEVEMVDSVDDIKTTQSIRGHRHATLRCADRFLLAGGIPASSSLAPLLQQFRRHLSVHSFHRSATCRGVTSLAASLTGGPLRASRARPPSYTGHAIECWNTSLLPVLSCLPWEGKFMRYVLTDDT